MKILEISKSEFDAVCYARNAHIMPMLKEIQYYRVDGMELYGVIALDITDGDFGALVLGRDADKRFRAIEVPTKFYDSPKKAVKDLEHLFAKAISEGSTFEQGDEKGKPNELYKIVAKNVSSSFNELTTNPIYSSANEFIGEDVYAYVDVDGNYIKDFQSTGFNARLWELYLYIFLKHQGFEFDNSFNAPDYLVDKFGVTIALEATTVNHDAKFDEPYPNDESDIFKLVQDYMPIKFGSSLFSKLQKEYWRREHVRGKPLIFALHDFHMLELLYWSQRALRNYLYGSRYKAIFDDGSSKLELDARSLPIPEAIARHSYKHKDIPSNFFNQPGAEFVSGVLYCNNATLDTFNGIGKLAKMGDYKRKIVRVAETNDLESSSYRPKVMVENVDDKNYEEAWEDTMCLFHNPNGKHPIPRELFSGITHCYFDLTERRWIGPRRAPEILKCWNKYS